MKTRSKFFLAIGILLVTSFSTILAQDFRNPPDLQVSIHPSFSLKTGSVGEYLFNMTGYGKPVSYAPNGGKQMSFLQWDINALIEGGLEVGFQYKSFVALINGKVGIPMKTGKMDDFDWYAKKGHQTHFSTHTNKITSHYILGGALGWEFPIREYSISILPLVGFTWQRTSMMATDGYTQYVTNPENTPWTPDIEKKYLSGNVISYIHEVYQIDCILRLTYNYSPKLFFSIEGSIHPVIAAYGFDSHIVKGVDYLDYDMKGKVALGLALTMGVQVIPKHFLTFRLNYSSLPIIIGQSYSKGTNQQYYYPDASSRGGADNWFVGVTLGWKFNIFQ